MKPNHITYIVSLLILAAGFSACKKQIAIDPPNTKIVTTNVFNNDGTATAALLSIYTQIRSLPYVLHQATGLSSDELNTNAIDQISKDLYLNSLSANDATNLFPSFQFWTSSYQYIYAANAVLENLQQSSGVSPKVKQQLIGEAQFIRAYLFFYLVNLYGDVPMATTTDYKVNSVLQRTPKVQVYQQMVQDLTNAQSNLSSKYVDATDTASTSDRIRPTVWAAHALLARVYLFMGNGNYDKAELEAKKVIDNAALFSLPTDLNTVFKQNSSEAIWQIAQYDGSGNVTFTSDATGFVLSAPPSVNTAKSSTISTQLINAFESGDQRRVNWIGTYTNGISSWNYPAKYKDNAITASSSSEYTTILRLAEQYLIRAEARAQQGNTTGALADLNVIRNRAGLPNYAGAMDQTSIISAISHERQVELFAEGDRWINLKRTGSIDAVMGIVTAQKGGNWNSYQQLYPVPPSEVLNDPNLTQNPGY